MADVDRCEDVLIVGGGLSGLCCALAAAKRGASVRLFEAEGSVCGTLGRSAVHRLVADRILEDASALAPLELPQAPQDEAGVKPIEVLQTLSDAVTQSEIEVVTDAAITRLLYSDGHCCGCIYTRDNQEIKVQGKVILCCGGILSEVHPFGSLMALHRPDLLDWPMPMGLGGPCLLSRCGAQLVDLQKCRIFATAEAGSARRARRLLPRSLRGHLLCSDGEVQQEHRTEEEIAMDILRRGPCWLLRADRHPDAGRSLRQVTLKELAAEMDLRPTRLVKVLETLKLKAAGGQGDDEECDLWVARVTPAILCCEGGVAVGGDGAVLSDDDRPIPGLFAAGEAAASSESSLSSCVSSAVRAAAAAVAAGPVPCSVVSQACDLTSPVARHLRSRDPSPTKLHQRLAMKRLNTFLQTRLTAETLRRVLLRSVENQNLDSALEELVSQLSGTAKETAMLQLRDPVSYLKTRSMLAALPEGGVATSEVSTTCVHCRLPLKFQVSAEKGGRKANGYHETESNGKGYAYATLLYGSGVEYFLGALVLGWSLVTHGCQEGRVLLYTQDVPAVFLDALQIFWTLRQVEYLNSDPSLYIDKEASRFKAVFTKIQVLSCTEYSKVLMMDLDMLVRGNLDELFHLRAPAALKRCSGREQPEHGEDYVSEDFYKPQGDDMRGGMNAGVMLLEPNLQIYQRMCREIEDPRHPEHLGSFTPEQDYLGRFYGAFARGKWTHLHAKFNYQPNLPDDYTGEAHKALDVLQDVMVAHYSGTKVKPWKVVNMNVEGVRRLLEEDLQDQMGVDNKNQRANVAQARPTTTMMMDGVQVEVNRRSDGLPEDVRQLMWEWVLELRECNQQLLQDGVDILSLIEAAT